MALFYEYILTEERDRMENEEREKRKGRKNRGWKCKEWMSEWEVLFELLVALWGSTRNFVFNTF